MCCGSKKEALRYHHLRILQRAGEVISIVIHPSYPLVVNGVTIGKMTLDFEVAWVNGEVTWEDCKGGRATKTEAYSLRKRVLEACRPPIAVTEI